MFRGRPGTIPIFDGLNACSSARLLRSIPPPYRVSSRSLAGKPTSQPLADSGLDVEEVIKRTNKWYQSFDLEMTREEDIEKEFEEAVVRYGVRNLDDLTLMPVVVTEDSPLSMKSL